MRPWVPSQAMSLWEWTQRHLGFHNAWTLIHKEWCWAIKNQFVLAYMIGDGWAKLALHRLIWDVGEWVLGTYPFLDPRNLSKFEKRRSQQLYPTFKTSFETCWAKWALNIKFLKGGGWNRQFRPSLRNFTDNSNARHFSNHRFWCWIGKCLSCLNVFWPL